MEMRLRNILMLIFPTSFLGLTYFWWWQKKVKEGERKDDVKEVLKVSKVVSEEIITEVLEEETMSHDSEYLPLDDDKLDDSLTLQEYNHASIKRKREHSSCDSAFVEDFSSDSVSTTGSDINSNKTGSTNENPESPTLHNEETPEKMSPTDIVCEEIIAPEVSDNVESAPSNNFRDWFTPQLESETEKDDLKEIIHWGSQPVSDFENDDETNMMNKEFIGGVAIEKLNIVLEKEYDERKSNMKKSERPKRSPKKSSQTPKKSPRTPKKSPRTPRTPKTSESKCPPKSPKHKKSPNQKDRSLDKPWREPLSNTKDIESDSDCVPLYPNDFVVMEYTVSEDLCGKIIGKHGKAVKEINEKTGAIVCIENEKVGSKCLLSISGLYCQVQEAEKFLMTKHKNSLKKYTTPCPKEISVGNSSLPMDVYVNVIVTAVIDAGNLFLQMFDADVDQKLMQLQHDLGKAYNQPPQRVLYNSSKKPALDEVCVAFVDNMWCRMKVLEYTNDDQAVVVFIDYGGNIILDWNLLYSIRFGFCFFVIAYSFNLG